MTSSIKNKHILSRRNFLKISALLGIALLSTPESIAQATSITSVHSKAAQISKKRILGSGKYSMEVSSIGIRLYGHEL